MRTIICSALSTVLLCSSTFFLHRPKETEESLHIPEVNLVNHPKIYSILKRIVKEAKSDCVHYISVFLKNDTSGISMHVVAQTKSSLVWYDGYTGYTCINDMPIIFTNHSNLDFVPISGKQGVFPMDAPYKPPFVYDPDVWRFILKEDSYARYYDDRGWVWFQDNETKNYDCQ